MIDDLLRKRHIHILMAGRVKLGSLTLNEFANGLPVIRWSLLCHDSMLNDPDIGLSKERAAFAVNRNRVRGGLVRYRGVVDMAAMASLTDMRRS